MNTLFTGFQNRYPQEFLDELAKILGVEWVPIEMKTVPKESVTVLSEEERKPLGLIFYMDTVYNKTGK